MDTYNEIDKNEDILVNDRAEADTAELIEETVNIAETVDEEDNRSRDELLAATEAILFSMGDAVELPHLAQAVGLSREDMSSILEELTKRYQEDGRGLQIIELEGAYQMCTRKEMYDYLVRIAHVPKPKELTDVMLETLSIIAYKQPITKIEIAKIRGVNSDHTVNKLVDYNLICEAGRKDAPGRPILFATTEEFLRSFGIESTEELPSLDADLVEDFKQEAENEVAEGQMKLDI